MICTLGTGGDEPFGQEELPFTSVNHVFDFQCPE